MKYGLLWNFGLLDHAPDAEPEKGIEILKGLPQEANIIRHAEPEKGIEMWRRLAELFRSLWQGQNPRKGLKFFGIVMPMLRPVLLSRTRERD